MAKGKLMGIGLFAMQILGLISMGVKEPVKVIEKHFDAKNIVEYLYEKYERYFRVKFDDILYDNEAINEFFSQYRDKQSCGLDDDDGLLFVLAQIMSKVETEANYWEP